MSRDNFIKSMLSDKVCMTPAGFNADDLSPEEFAGCYELFFDKILEISIADVSDIEGYGEFNDDCKTEYTTLREFLIGTFREDEDGYWYNWKELFETTIVERDFFDYVYQAVIVLKGNTDYKLFMKQYGNVFHYYGEV